MADNTSPPPPTALITGASRGLGRALAFELGRRGTRVALVARGEATLFETRDALRAEGIQAEAFPADIADKMAIYPLAGQVQAYLDGVHLLINAASSLGPTPLRQLLDLECEELSAVFETNLVGSFRLSKAILGPMLARGRGTVVNISSDAALEAYPHWGAYGASKAAMDHLSAIWDAELSDQGVRVLAVDPGEMDTQMHAAALPDADPSTLARPEEVARWIVESLPAWRRAPATRHSKGEPA